MASNFALPEKKHKIGKKIVFLGIAIVLVFLVYYFLYVYSFDTFRILQNRSLPLTENDREKGYIGKYILSIEHVYGPIMDRKKETITIGEADFSSENDSKAVFSEWISALKSEKIHKEYNFSFYITHLDSLVVKGYKVEIFEETPLNSTTHSYLVALRSKNRIMEFFLKKYDKIKLEKLVEWILNQ